MSEIEIVLAGVLAALTIAVVIIIRLQRGLKEVKELYMVIKGALADGKITKKELDSIFKEAKDVADVVLEMVALINRR